MYILGINSTYHESSACLLQDGVMVAFVEEERFTRIKHAKPARIDNPDELPRHAIQFCLTKAGISLQDVAYIGLSFLPHKRLEHNIEFHNNVTPAWGTASGEQLFYEKHMNIPIRLTEMAESDISPKFHFLPHHLCHAASAFYVSPFANAAILVIDGIAEFASTWIGYGQNNRLFAMREIFYPDSLGLLWEKIAEFLGFTVYDSSKVMWLAAYGKSHHKLSAMMKNIIRLNSDGTFNVNHHILKFRSQNFIKLEKLFKFKKRNDDDILSIHEDIAAALQKTTEDVFIHLIKKLYRATEEYHVGNNICLAGSVALNCVANGKILANTSFNNIFIQPAAHDAGTALGAAYYLWNQVLDNVRAAPLTHVYYGPEYTNEEIIDALKQHNMSYQKRDDVAAYIANLLSQGKIVAWFNGSMEFGPRALGNRSILGDPRNRLLRDILNQKIKYCELFRPFGPSVLEEDAKEWFEIIDEHRAPAYYMLMAYKVKSEKVALIPAVIHKDHTARIQLVNQTINPKYYALLSEFKKLTGIPMLLNTSFNIQEPMVCSPVDAINTFKNSSIDYLVMSDYVVENSL